MMGHESMGSVHLLWMLVWAVILIVPFWRIRQRAGYSGWLSLLILVPLVNLGYIYFLAFASGRSQKDYGRG
ncbi:MAG: hypothetical protein U5J63_04020 [Fodinibius sp.]|nr:hypothetical protein [Fodinibius sp.]